ncbi:hypothetical protein BU15DRAFT_41847 [Melanogaster broomeanus]|nr:hypothetical protein BU15DRAFT_41847 [Melanogaster broomeanus]
MQNPKDEILAIVTTLTSTTSNSELCDTLSRYFTPDAKFVHPVCMADSRAEIRGIYQWYRIMSPKTKCNVISVIYDSDQNVIVLEMVQWFHLRISPTGPAAARLISRLILREISGLHYIARQEDLYPTLDLVALMTPNLAVFPWLFLKLASLLSNLFAWLFWKVGITGGGLEGGQVNLTGLKEGLGLGTYSEECRKLST